jgi:predicted transcriptional regulator/N-acetylneuraminic acid mutarotase
MAASVVIGNQALVIGGDEGFFPRYSPDYTALYDLENDTWLQLPPLPKNRTALVAASLAEEAYAMGGYDPAVSIPSSEVYQLNMTTATWSSAPPMPTARYGLGGASVGGKIYALGGVISPQTDSPPVLTAAVEEFDPRTGSWIQKSSMPTKRAFFATVVIGDNLLVVGGLGEQGEPLSSIEVYDPVMDYWSFGGRMPTPRIGPVAAAINGTLYVVGGEGDMYDANNNFASATEEWTRKTPLPTLRYGLEAVVSKGRIHTIGGSRHLDYVPTSGHVNVAEVYDPDLDSWESVMSMPNPRRNFGIAKIDGLIFTIGGYYNDTTIPSDIVDVYNVTNGSWYETTSLPIPIECAEATSLDGKAYVVTDNRTFSFDPQNELWVELAPFPNPRLGFSLVASNGHLYALGGSDPGALNLVLVPEVDVYSPVNDTWWTATSLPTPRDGSGAVSLKGEIYVMGGTVQFGGTNIVEIFDPMSGSWRTGPSMLAPRDRFGSVVFNGEIYVLGGSRGRIKGDYFGLNEKTDAFSTLIPEPPGPDILPAVALTIVACKEIAFPNDVVELTVFYNNTGGSSARDVEIRRNFSLAVEIVEELSSISNGTRYSNGTWYYSYVEPGSHSISLRLRLPSDIRASATMIASFVLDYGNSLGGGRESVSATVTITIRPFEPPYPWVTLVLVIAICAGVVGLLTSLSEPLRFHFIGFYVILLARLSREQVLENEKRGMIRGYLAANPGANFASIREDLGMATGTLVYHLGVLKREGIIKSWNDGRFKRFALTGHVIADLEPKLTDFELILLQMIQDNPESTQADLARKVGIGQSTISYHMTKLTKRGFVNSKRQGLQKRYTVNIDKGPSRCERR